MYIMAKTRNILRYRMKGELGIEVLAHPAPDISILSPDGVTHEAEDEYKLRAEQFSPRTGLLPAEGLAQVEVWRFAMSCVDEFRFRYA